MTKEDYMKLSKERLAELLAERDAYPSGNILLPNDPRPLCGLSWNIYSIRYNYHYNNRRKIMKSHTDLPQSKMLAEFLPLESADMFYLSDGNVKLMWEHLKDIPLTNPCWSLAALLGVIPEGVLESYYVPNIQKEDGRYTIAYGDDELLCIADNPIDACVEMIFKLKEENLI